VAEFLGLAGSKFKVRVSSICRGPPPGRNGPPGLCSLAGRYVLSRLNSGTETPALGRVVMYTEYTELQPLLSGVHSVMGVKLALAGEGGGHGGRWRARTYGVPALCSL
jgi:hypothetical protein